MATGPDHYRKAERLLTSADIALGQYEERGWEQKRVMADSLTAQAQVHATLALAAATALRRVGELPVADHDAWWAAAGSAPVRRAQPQGGGTGE